MTMSAGWIGSCLPKCNAACKRMGRINPRTILVRAWWRILGEGQQKENDRWLIYVTGMKSYVSTFGSGNWKGCNMALHHIAKAIRVLTSHEGCAWCYGWIFGQFLFWVLLREVLGAFFGAACACIFACCVGCCKGGCWCHGWHRAGAVLGAVKKVITNKFCSRQSGAQSQASVGLWWWWIEWFGNRSANFRGNVDFFLRCRQV